MGRFLGVFTLFSIAYVGLVPELVNLTSLREEARIVCDLLI